MKRPYEFLIRWDLATGRVQGAHVGFGNVFVEDGSTHIGSIEPVQPVALGTERGFPLAEIIGHVNVTALKQCEALAQELADVRAANAQAVAALEADKAVLQQGLAEALAAVQQLQGDKARLEQAFIEAAAVLEQLQGELVAARAAAAPVDPAPLAADQGQG